jgi:hypothetical protein
MMSTAGDAGFRGSEGAKPAANPIPPADQPREHEKKQSYAKQRIRLSGYEFRLNAARRMACLDHPQRASGALRLYAYRL